MVLPRSARFGIPFFAISLFVLLVGLAVLQYRWIEEIAGAERDRARNLMRVSAERLADDVNRELMRIHLEFRPEQAVVARDLTDRYRRWHSTSTFPELIEAVFRLQGESTTTLDLRSGEMQPARLPAQLADALAASPRFGGAGLRMGPRRGPFLSDPLAFVVPAGAPPFHADPSPGAPSIFVITINEAYLTSVVIPALAARHQPSSGSLPYVLSVWRGDHRVFPREGALPPPEFAVPLLNFNDLHDLPMEREHRDRLAFPPGEEVRESPPPGHRRFGRRFAPPPQSIWRVEVSHPSGALDLVVMRSKRRNLAVSGAILALLALAIALAVAAALRATRTAQQQMEFVASITHELNTPLAAIRSAAENLSDGIISDPERVQRYGATILQHESRLAAMISEALMFAGITARRWQKPVEPIALPALIGQAVADVEASTGHSLLIEQRIAPDLPVIRGEARMLKSALVNLLQNALRHGGSRKPIVIEAQRAGGAVAISVADCGPGIPAEELPRIFEPFFRGRGATPGTGAGLGLSIVKRVIDAHGGTIHATSSSSAGTTMRVTLPADV